MCLAAACSLAVTLASAGCADDSDDSDDAVADDGAATANGDGGDGNGDADDSTFGTGLSCFMFPEGEVQVPDGWPYAIPSGLVLGSFDNLNPGSSNVAGATDEPTEVIAELVDTIFADLDPTSTAEDDNNLLYDFSGGSISGQIQAFSADGGFDTPTCVRIDVSYVEMQ